MPNSQGTFFPVVSLLCISAVRHGSPGSPKVARLAATAELPAHLPLRPHQTCISLCVFNPSLHCAQNVSRREPVSSVHVCPAFAIDSHSSLSTHKWPVISWEQPSSLAQIWPMARLYYTHCPLASVLVIGCLHQAGNGIHFAARIARGGYAGPFPGTRANTPNDQASR